MGEHNPELRDCLACLRSHLKGRRAGGNLVMQLVDMSLKFDKDSELSGAELRAPRVWKNWANGSDPTNPDIAGEVAGLWNSFKFGQRLDEDYSEEAVIGLVGPLGRLIPSIYKVNVSEELGKYLHRVFKRIVGQDEVLETPLSVEDSLRASGRPYFDKEQHKIRIGDYAVKTPRIIEVPREIQPNEHTYVAVLIRAATIAKLRHGSNATTDILLKICNALDCSISDILET